MGGGRSGDESPERHMPEHGSTPGLLWLPLWVAAVGVATDGERLDPLRTGVRSVTTSSKQRPGVRSPALASGPRAALWWGGARSAAVGGRGSRSRAQSGLGGSCAVVAVVACGGRVQWSIFLAIPMATFPTRCDAIDACGDHAPYHLTRPRSSRLCASHTRQPACSSSQPPLSPKCPPVAPADLTDLR